MKLGLFSVCSASLFALFFVFLPVARTEQIAGAVDVGLIVVGTDQEAQEILTQLKAGMDFGVLAKEKSIDRTAADGGYLGRLERSKIRAELRGAVKDLRPGHF